MLSNGKHDAIIAYDSQRDGMFLEVRELGDPLTCSLEIFYSDITKTFSITLYKEDVELELVEEAIAIAKSRLVIAADKSST